MIGNTMGLCAARFTRLDTDGSTVVDDETGAWTVCDLVSVDITPEYDQPTPVTQRDGCGNVRIYRRRDDQPTGITINNLQVCTADPRLFELVLSGHAVTLGTPTITGWALRAPGCATITRAGIALELWVEQWLCNSPNVDTPYRRLVVPKARLRYNGGTHDEGVFLYSFSGFGEANPSFGNGPFNDLDNLAAVDDFIYAEYDDTALPVCPDPADYTATPVDAS